MYFFVGNCVLVACLPSKRVFPPNSSILKSPELAHFLTGERSVPFPCVEGSDRGGVCAAEGGPAGVWGCSPQRGPRAEHLAGGLRGQSPPENFDNMGPQNVSETIRKAFLERRNKAE